MKDVQRLMHCTLERSVFFLLNFPFQLFWYGVTCAAKENQFIVARQLFVVEVICWEQVNPLWNFNGEKRAHSLIV